MKLRGKFIFAIFYIIFFINLSLPNLTFSIKENASMNLFDIHTPIQCVRAVAIALENPQDVNDAVIFPCNHSEEFIQNTKKVFNNVYLYNSEQDMKIFSEKKYKYDRFFSSNCYHYYIWGMIGDFYKSYYHYEDGCAEYISDCFDNFYCDKEKAKKLFSLYPKYRCKELQDIPAEQISHESFLNAIDILYDKDHIDKKIIYCLDHPDDLNRKVAKQIFNSLKAYSGNVAVKCHPRDSRSYILPNGFKEIDRHITFENYYLNFKGIIISQLSSVLYTAKFMSPENTVICTNFIDKPVDLSGKTKNYILMLKNLGVLFPQSIEELKNIISENYG